MSNVVNLPLDLLFVSFLVMVKVKRDIIVMIQLVKSFMSLVMLCFLNIPFYSMPSDTPNLLKSDLIRIDSFESCTVDTSSPADDQSQLIDISYSYYLKMKLQRVWIHRLLFLLLNLVTFNELVSPLNYLIMFTPHIPLLLFLFWLHTQTL